MDTSIIISLISVLIAIFSLFIVLLNRNDKFRPNIYIYYSSVRENNNERICVENFSDVPGLISRIDMKYKNELYSRIRQPEVLLPLNDDITGQKSQYLNVKDQLKKACEYRTFLPGEKIIIPLNDVIVTPDKNTFEELSLSELRRGYLCDDFEATGESVSVCIKYQKTFNTLGFNLVKFDKFNEKILVLKSRKKIC